MRDAVRREGRILRLRVLLMWTRLLLRWYRLHERVLRWQCAQLERRGADSG